MSTIPYNYGKYINDKVSMNNSGTVDAGKQVNSPASAGSRGLAKTTQFTKDPTQMKMGNSPIAESIIEIRNILNRIDGVNVPVQEDAHDDWSKVTNALIKKYGEDKAKAITDYAQIGTDSAEELMKSHGLTHKGDGKDEERWFQKYPWLKQLANKSWMGRLKDIAGEGPDYGTPVKMESAVQEGHYPHIKSFDKLYGINDKQQYKAMADDAQSMDMGEFMDTYSSVIDMAGDFWEDHQKTSESMEGTVNEDPNTLAKELASEIMRWVRRGFDHIPADALKPKAREYLRSVKKPAVKEDNMQDLAIHDIEAQLGKINDEITFLQIDQKDKESALAALGELRSVLDKYQSQQESAVNELADDDKIEFTKVMLDISQIKDRVEALSVDEDAKKSAIQSLTNAEEALVALDESAVREDAGSLTDQQKQGLQAVHNKFKGHVTSAGGSLPYEYLNYEIEPELYSDMIDSKEEDKAAKAFGYDSLEDVQRAMDNGEIEGDYPEDIEKYIPITMTAWAAVDSVLKDANDEQRKAARDYLLSISESAVSEDEDELARLKELSGIEEDTRTERRYTSDQIDQLKQWAKKYSQYKNIEGENLIEALYEYVFEMGIRQLAFEKGELQAAEKKIGKAQEDWEDAEIEAAMEMSPISSGLMDDLENIIPGDVELEKKLDTIRTMLQKAGLKEDPYQPFPEEDEMTFEDDDAFYEAFGELGFPEDENELFDAEYRGRKVPLNKPMRGDVKKFKVYVKDPKTGNVKKVNFGHGGSSARKAGQKTMKIRKSNPKARKSFRARHNCANPGPKTRARYWSCRAW